MGSPAERDFRRCFSTPTFRIPLTLASEEYAFAVTSDGSATFRRPRGRWHGPADRHKTRPRRAAELALSPATLPQCCSDATEILVFLAIVPLPAAWRNSAFDGASSCKAFVFCRSPAAGPYGSPHQDISLQGKNALAHGRIAPSKITAAACARSVCRLNLLQINPPALRLRHWSNATY